MPTRLLRRLDSQGWVKDGIVDSRAFKCRNSEKELSFFDYDPIESRLEEFCAYLWLKSGDAPGWFLLDPVRVSWLPKLRHDPNDEIPVWGAYHYASDCLGWVEGVNIPDGLCAVEPHIFDRIATDCKPLREFKKKPKPKK